MTQSSWTINSTGVSRPTGAFHIIPPSRCALLDVNEWRATLAGMQETRRITLLDLEGLFDLWNRYYAELSETEKQLLPLKPVYFLAPED